MKLKCELEHFLGLVIFMSMYNDIVWGKKGNREIGVANSLIGAEYVEILRKDIGRFLGLDQSACKPYGEWDRVADIMLINFSESGRPVFR